VKIREIKDEVNILLNIVFQLFTPLISNISNIKTIQHIVVKTIITIDNFNAQIKIRGQNKLNKVVI